MEPIVVVEIRGGVANVVRKSAGVRVEVLDFDVDGAEERMCTKRACEFHGEHIHNVWDAGEEFDEYAEEERGERAQAFADYRREGGEDR
jgi:hypothetical protein